jgi:hypothetical protein
VHQPRCLLQGLVSPWPHRRRVLGLTGEAFGLLCREVSTGSSVSCPPLNPELLFSGSLSNKPLTGTPDH